MVLKCIGLVLEDEGFRVPSPGALKAKKTAAGVLAWSKEDGNRECFAKFSKWVICTLEPCIKVKGSLRLRNEKMWGAFNRVRTTDEFRSGWEDFLEKVGHAAFPDFFQYVTSEVFKVIIKHTNQVCINKRQQDHEAPLTMEEENALRYVSGHVCRKVQQKISSSSITNKEDMILFIVDLSGDELGHDGIFNGTEAWIDAIDRGGLWHVNNDTYAILSYRGAHSKAFYLVICR